MAKARQLSFGKKLLFTAMALAPTLLILVAIINARPDLVSSGGTGEKVNINIVSIGGWNVWWFIAFWMLSQCILVHHARRK